MTKVDKIEKPFPSYYSLIAKKCECSPSYVRKVLEKKLGKYNKRNNELTKRIRTTHEELYAMFLNSN